ncbi:MAG: hypothetical protein ACFFD4_29185 [Candidatus Odinarchaeota archaeon]
MLSGEIIVVENWLAGRCEGTVHGNDQRTVLAEKVTNDFEWQGSVQTVQGRVIPSPRRTTVLVQV